MIVIVGVVVVVGFVVMVHFVLFCFILLVDMLLSNWSSFKEYVDQFAWIESLAYCTRKLHHLQFQITQTGTRKHNG